MSVGGPGAGDRPRICRFVAGIGGSLPESAVELARRHGIYRTARSLPIDYVNLRKRVNGAAPSTTVARPEFVEVLMAPSQPAACIEVLRVPVTGAVDLHQLFRAWRNGGR